MQFLFRFLHFNYRMRQPQCKEWDYNLLEVQRFQKTALYGNLAAHLAKLKMERLQNVLKQNVNFQNVYQIVGITKMLISLQTNAKVGMMDAIIVFWAQKISYTNQ